MQPTAAGSPRRVSVSMGFSFYTGAAELDMSRVAEALQFRLTAAQMWCASVPSRRA
jgi:hypothetical protein